MDAESFKRGIKAFVDAVKKGTPPESQKFMDVKASDGTILSYDGETPMAGMPVFILDEAGQRLPAVTADYTLEDGSVLKIQDGVIMEVVATAPAEDMNKEQEKKNEMEANSTPPAPTQIPKSVIESQVKEYRFQEQIDELKTKLEDKTEVEAKFKSMTDKIEAQEKTIKGLIDLFEKFAALPSEPSKQEKKDGFVKKTEDENPLKKFADFHKQAFNL